MGLFRKKKVEEPDTVCKTCGLKLPTAERLDKHMKKAHGNIPEKKFDPGGGDGTW